MRRKKIEKTDFQKDLKEWEYDYDFFEEYSARAKYNEFQAEYYDWMSEEYEEEKYARRAQLTRECSKIWSIDFYAKNGFKQVIGVNRCKDPFCYNCQALRARRRFEVFAPFLEQYEDDYEVYHIIFTVPNVSGKKLASTVLYMFDRFGRIIEYFNGDKKIKGFDFEKFGYIGAVRALEITTGKRAKIDGDDFHPHFHCMFILRKGMNFVHDQYNSFSDDKFDEDKSTYFHSAFEILLQRVWCLLMCKIKVTQENVRNIWQATNGRFKDGFSVRAYPANRRWKNGKWEEIEGKDKYHELFKYAIKGTYKNESIFTREQFVAMFNAINKRHVYQTYGVLRELNFNEVDDSISEMTKTDIKFDQFLQALQRSEKPLRTETSLDAILLDVKANLKRKKKIRYFGPSTFRKMFSKKTEEELQGMLDEWIKELR